MTHPTPDTGLTAENRAARRGLITASAWPAICAGGARAEKELARIAGERLGLPDKTRHATPAMRHGIANEARVIADMQDAPPADIGSAIVAANDTLVTATVAIGGNDVTVGCTPDAFLVFADGTDDPATGIAQIKSPFTAERFAKISQEPDPDHVAQVQFEAWVLIHAEDSAGRSRAPIMAKLVYGNPSPDDQPRFVQFDVAIPHQDEDCAIGAAIAAGICAAESRIAELMNDLTGAADRLNAQLHFPSMPDDDFCQLTLAQRVQRIANAKAALKAIDDERKAIAKIATGQAKAAGEDFVAIVEDELDVLQQIADAPTLKPAGTRETTIEKPVEIDETQLPAKFWRDERIPDAEAIATALAAGDLPERFVRTDKVIDAAAIDAALKAGEAVPGVTPGETIATLTVVAKKHDSDVIAAAKQEFKRLMVGAIQPADDAQLPVQQQSEEAVQ